MKRHLLGVTIAMAVSAAADPAVAQEAAPDAPVETGTAERDSGDDLSRRWTIGGATALTAGIVGIGLGTFLLVRGKQRESDADGLRSRCMLCAADPQTLDTTQVAQLNEERAAIEKKSQNAQDDKNLSVLFYGLGVTGIVGGIVLLTMRDDDDGEQASVTPVVGPRAVGLRGVF